MSEVIFVDVKYTDPTVKEFKEHMISEDADENIVNVVVGIHFPTKLGLAKGIRHDFEKVSGRKPKRMKRYIEDYKENWI